MRNTPKLLGWTVEYGDHSSVSSTGETEDGAIARAFLEALYQRSVGSEIRYIQLYCASCGGHGTQAIYKRAAMRLVRCPHCKGKDSKRNLELPDYQIHEGISFVRNNFEHVAREREVLK